MTDESVSSDLLEAQLYFSFDGSTYMLTIECTNCSREGYIFYTGSLSYPSGYIAKCIVHIQNHHPELLLSPDP